MKINNVIKFFQNKQAINFIKSLNEDKRRLLLIKKILSILFKYQNTRLTFDQILKETKLCRSSLSSAIRKLKLIGVISDYDTEKIIQKNKTQDGFEYAINNDEERFYYRYRYKLKESDEAVLLLSAIWALNITKKK